MNETAAIARPATVSAPNESTPNPPEEKRRHMRFSTTLQVRASWQDEFGLPSGSPGLVINVSAGGFGIEMNLNPPLSSLVTVTALQGDLECVVRHVRPQGERFIVGLELLPELDGVTATQSLQRLASALSEDRRARARVRSQE